MRWLWKKESENELEKKYIGKWKMTKEKRITEDEQRDNFLRKKERKKERKKNSRWKKKRKSIRKPKMNKELGKRKGKKCDWEEREM